MISVLARVLRLASIVICLIVGASFLTFAIQQTKSASGGQQEALDAGTPTATPVATSPAPHKGAVHKTLDEASEALTSPFSGLVSGSSSEWLARSVELVLALLLYGFGLAYLARILRVRA